MNLLGLHLLEKRINVSRLRYEMSFPQKTIDLTDRDHPITAVFRSYERILHVKDAGDIVNIFFIHRISGIVAFLQNEVYSLTESHGTIQSHQIFPVGHDITGVLIVQFENIGDHLRLSGL